MKKPFPVCRRTAFTRTELLMVTVMLCLLGASALTLLTRAKKPDKAIVCANNLRLIGNAYHLYTDEHNQQLPWEPISPPHTGARFEELAAHTKEPRIWWCPSDTQRTAAASFSPGNFIATNHASYFINTFATHKGPVGIMLGDRHINASGVVTWGTAVAWGRPGVIMHEKYGNLLFSDGSVIRANNQQLPSFFKRYVVSRDGATANIHLPE